MSQEYCQVIELYVSFYAGRGMFHLLYVRLHLILEIFALDK